MPCQIIIGSDPILIHDQITSCIKQTGWSTQLPWNKFDFEETGIEPVLRHLSHRDLFCSQQVIIFDFCHFLLVKKKLLVKAYRQLVTAVKNCPSNIWLFLVARTNKKITLLNNQPFTKIGVSTQIIKKLTASELTQKLKVLVGKTNSSIDQLALKKLLAIAPAENYTFLFHTIHKLVLITSHITESVVNNNVTPCVTFNVFRLVNFFLTNQQDLFLDLFQIMQRSHFDVHLFLAAFSYRVNDCHQKILTNQKTYYQLHRNQLEWLIDQLFVMNYDFRTKVIYNEVGLYCRVIELFSVWNL